MSTIAQIVQLSNNNVAFLDSTGATIQVFLPSTRWTLQSSTSITTSDKSLSPFNINVFSPVTIALTYSDGSTGSFTGNATDLYNLFYTDFFFDLSSIVPTGGPTKFGWDFVVGNELEGDTITNCDFLDPGDGTGIDAAVTAATNAGGGDIYVRSGNYIISTTISVLGSNIRLVFSEHANIQLRDNRKFLDVQGSFVCIENLFLNAVAIVPAASGTEMISFSGEYGRLFNCQFGAFYAASETLQNMVVFSAPNCQVLGTQFRCSSFVPGTSDLCALSLSGVNIATIQAVFDGPMLAVNMDTCSNVFIAGTGTVDRWIDKNDSSNVRINIAGEAVLSNLGSGSPYDAAIFIEIAQNTVISGSTIETPSIGGIAVDIYSSNKTTVTSNIFDGFTTSVQADAGSALTLLNLINQ